ncbi:MAG: L-arabinose isomerase [Stecheria intestinalis]|nr:L-arabinose isomerase [Stecheria intestinalis]MDY4682391.1 L-arabinose isomerase [Lachnospiraceae bacterium]
MKEKMKNYTFWFIVGSQDLYGEEVLKIVAEHGKRIADAMTASGNLPYPLEYRLTGRNCEEITEVIKQANRDDSCAGIVTFCHTFSPSKMWINGLSLLQKPYCHFATQFNKEIPNDEIDMDFMNLNQAAHGDREHGYIGARMHLPVRVIAGHWSDSDTQKELGDWMCAAVASIYSRTLKVMRFGDNMREVAVTEGDKVEAQIRFGWQVNTCPVGKLAEVVEAISAEEENDVMNSYQEKYELRTDNLASVRYQARLEAAIRKLLKNHGCDAFSTNFQDLYGLRQLPGLAAQDLMAKGYGFGAEGDWKVAAMLAIIQKMSKSSVHCSTFMEYYTYHLSKEKSYTLGAHMLEVDPSVAASKPVIEVFPLDIGGKEDPARLVFEGKEGNAVISCLVDMGDHLRLIAQDIHCIKPLLPMPNLPVARVMWEPLPSLKTGLECWIMAGGSHHTVLSYDISARQLQDFARITGVEFLHIGENTTAESFEHELEVNDLIWKMRTYA